MTNEELMRIYNADPENGEEIIMQLYEQNVDLIWDIANKRAEAFECLDSTAYSQSIREELASEGTLAFLEAISSGKYKESLGKVTTYVYPFIKGAMYRWLEQNTSAVAISRKKMERIRQVRKLYGDRKMSPAEIAQELKISEEEVASALEYRKQYISIDDLKKAKPTVDNCIHIDNMLSQQNGVKSVEHTVMTKIWLEKLPEIFDQLSKRDRFVQGHSYGIYGYEKMKAAELAFRLELTMDGVYKARDTAIRHARETYYTSDLYLWRRAYVDTKVTAIKGL